MNACAGEHAWKVTDISLGLAGVGSTGYTVECKTCGTVEDRPGRNVVDRARQQIQDNLDDQG